MSLLSWCVGARVNVKQLKRGLAGGRCFSFTLAKDSHSALPVLFLCRFIFAQMFG